MSPVLVELTSKDSPLVIDTEPDVPPTLDPPDKSSDPPIDDDDDDDDDPPDMDTDPPIDAP